MPTPITNGENERKKKENKRKQNIKRNEKRNKEFLCAAEMVRAQFNRQSLNFFLC